MTTRPSARLRAAIADFEAAAPGRQVVALRLHPSGAIDLLTEAPESPPLAGEAHGDWVDLAGETTIHRA